MPFGIPRSDEERTTRHKSLFGEGSEPPLDRLGIGPKDMGIPEEIYDLLPALPLEFGPLTLPVPRGLMRSIAGTKQGENGEE